MLISDDFLPEVSISSNVEAEPLHLCYPLVGSEADQQVEPLQHMSVPSVESMFWSKRHSLVEMHGGLAVHNLEKC